MCTSRKREGETEKAHVHLGVHRDALKRVSVSLRWL